jgi:hypothetical protein
MNIEPAVFDQLGRAILEAQALEEALVRENLALDPQANTLDAAAVAVLEQELKQKNLGALLASWRTRVPPNQGLFEYLSDVREDRNLLAHRLFRDRRFKTSRDYLDEISRITQRLRSAQYLIFARNPAMTAELDAKWGITVEDRKG